MTDAGNQPVRPVRSSNYWNPFGPTVFANGSVNPNRLPNLNVPASGLAVTLRGYTFADLGLTEVDVTNKQYRVLGGLRGEKFGFDWESAFVYAEATAKDVADNISTTKLYAQLALSTPDAYNVFSGSDLLYTSGPDSTRNSQAAIDAIRVETIRRTKSTLALWDFKVSRPDLLTLPGGDLGVARASSSAARPSWTTATAASTARRPSPTRSAAWC